MALKATRKRGETIMLDNGTSIFIKEIRGNRVTLHVTEPDGTSTIITADDPDAPPEETLTSGLPAA